MKKILLSILLATILLNICGCHRNNQNPPDYLKATFNGVTHNYTTPTLAYLGTTTSLAGVENGLSGIQIMTPNNITGTYYFDRSNSSYVNIVDNFKAIESDHNGSIVTTFTNDNVSGSFSGYFMLDGGHTDSIYVSGSFSVSR